MRELLASIRKSLGVLRLRERRAFYLLTGFRCAVQMLDLVGIALIGLLGAMISASLAGADSFELFWLDLPTDSAIWFGATCSMIAVFFIGKSIFSAKLLKRTGLFLAETETEISSRIAKYLFSRGLGGARRFSRSEVGFATVKSANALLSGKLLPFSTLITEVFLLVIVLVSFFAINPITAAALLLYFALVLFVFHRTISRRLANIGVRMKNSSIAANHTILELSDAYKELWVTNSFERSLETFREERLNYGKTSAEQMFLLGVPRYFVESALMVGLLGLVGWTLVFGNIADDLLFLTVFLAGGARIMAALLPIQNSLATIKTNIPLAKTSISVLRDAEEFGEILSSAAKVSKDPIRVTRKPSSIVVKNLSFRFEDAEGFAIRDLSLSIHPGTFVALIGASGAGKTTLVDLLLGLHEPTSGSIEIDGKSPRNRILANPGDIAYVPQKPSVISGSIAKNVSLETLPSSIEDAKVEEVLRAAQLGSLLDRLGEGIHAQIGEKGLSLSGGETQRLGIARALYRSPTFMVLDEATSALDAKTESNIAQAIDSLGGKTTVLAIAHRLSTIRNADTVFVLDNGRLVDSGSFGELANRSKFVENHLRLMGIVG